MNPDIAAAIIAGGRSSRFGNINKARAMLGDKTLLEHVHTRLQPQVAQVYINAQSGSTAIDHMGSSLVVEDYVANRNGPLNGVLGALARAVEDGFDWLQIAPCDTPFLPLDLASTLKAAAVKDQLELMMPSYKGKPQASLSLWHSSLLEPLTRAVTESGAEGFKQFYPHTVYELVEWPQADYDPFHNINHQSDLSDAEAIYQRLATAGQG